MPLNLSIKNVPDALAERLRQRAERNHRSMQGELMALLEAAVNDVQALRADTPAAGYELGANSVPSDTLLDRLMAIAGDRGIDTTKRLTRDQAHDRKALRKAGI